MLTGAAGNPGIRLCSLFLCIFIAACSDYQQGYQDGYQGKQAAAWLVWGGEEYEAGFIEGQMQQSHDDWYAENQADMDESLSCPAVVARMSPVVVTDTHGFIDLGKEIHGNF